MAEPITGKLVTIKNLETGEVTDLSGAWAEVDFAEAITTDGEAMDESWQIGGPTIAGYAAQMSLYVEGIAAQSLTPPQKVFPGHNGIVNAWPDKSVLVEPTLPATPLIPASLDEIPGDFPTVDLIGIPSPSRRKFIEQIGKCDGFESPKPSGIDVVIKVDTTPMLQAILDISKKLNAAAVTIGKAVQPFVEAMTDVSGSASNVDRAEALHRRIPGVDEVVKAPCTCPRQPERLWTLIQHLNDHHNPESGHKDPWSRERIADWLDTLDVDLRVQDAPLFREGDRVRSKISDALGVVLGPGAKRVTVRWDKSGFVGPIDPTKLELLDGDTSGTLTLGVPGSKVNDTLAIGDIVQDVASGEAGVLIAAKKFYSLEKDQSVVELKVEYGTGVLHQAPDQVTKVTMPAAWTPDQLAALKKDLGAPNKFMYGIDQIIDDI